MATSKIEQPRRPASREGILLWVIHRFAEAFGHQAVLRGGMALRLLDSARFTNDLDYVFVPHSSKKEIVPSIEAILRQLQDATVEMSTHSTVVHYDIKLDQAAAQVEATVARRCPSIPMATVSLATPQGEHSRIVRIMEPGAALSHKLAAWNERRLLRDLYDAYFLVARTGAKPAHDILLARLARMQSRLPRLRKRKSMSLGVFLQELDAAVEVLTDALIQREMGGLIDATELAGIAVRMRTALAKLCEALRAAL